MLSSQNMLLFELESDGQTDSVPGVCNYVYVPLGLQGNIVMRNGQKNHRMK